MSRSRRRGITLVELMLVFSITAVIFAVTQALMARTIDSWWKVNAGADAQQQLYKAQNFLERDLAGAAFELEPGRETLVIEKRPVELNHPNLQGADGDAFWFLSAIDPVSGEFARLDNGEPFWQRNILYYVTAPRTLSTFDYLGAGLDVGGYESACPFKILVRKEIDFENPTSASTDPASTMECLMSYSDIAPYIDRPDGYSTVGMHSHNAAVRPISGNILSFRAEFDSQTAGVEIDLRATAIERARREGRIDNRDLSTNPATKQMKLTLFPPNRQGPNPTTCGGP